MARALVLADVRGERMRSLAALLFGAVVGASASAPVHADDIESVRNVQIALNGDVRQRCSLGSVGNVDFGNLERRGLGSRARVAFDCNVPFTMTITGQRGALTHTAMPQGQGPYAGALPYSLGVSLPIRHPSAETVTRAFASRELQAGGIISSNGGIAADGLSLSIELGAPSSEAGLLAGEYSETITITVSPL